MLVSKDSVYVLLQECAKRKDLVSARHVHSLMVSSGLDSVAILCDHLIRHFASYGSLLEANLLFCSVANPSLYTWHAIISAHATHGETERAIELYHKMQQEGTMPDKFIYTCILKACGAINDLGQGKMIHDQIIRSGFDTDMVVANSLVDMYAKCQNLEEARKVFHKLRNRDVVSWSTMIAAYAQYGYGIPALKLFQKMLGEGIKPDRVMYLSLLKACSTVGGISLGKAIHDQIIGNGLQSDIVVANTLVDMYTKCGSLEEAQKVFKYMPNRDVVSWSAIILGFSEHGYGFSALELFDEMQQEGIMPDRVIFLCILKACTSVGAIEKGREIHGQIIRRGLEANVAVGSTLIDMYVKCGNLEEAHIVLRKLMSRNVVSWNAIIGGYAEQGNCKMALQCLQDMQQEGLHPVASSYTNILTACSHAGKVKEGYWYFNAMKAEHGITPRIEHFNCMVDLLGRAGRLDEAKELLETMPLNSDISGWMSLLTACRKYGNVELGQQCFGRVAQLDSSDASSYVLMSSIYADAQRWEEVDKIREMRTYTLSWKMPGQAWIETKEKVHEFFVGDGSHPHMDKICEKQSALRRVMKQNGYVPQLSSMDSLLEGFTTCGVCEPLAPLAIDHCLYA